MNGSTKPMAAQIDAEKDTSTRIIKDMNDSRKPSAHTLFSGTVVEMAVRSDPILFGLIGSRGATPKTLEAYINRSSGPNQDAHVIAVLTIGALTGKQDEAVQVLDRTIPDWRDVFTAVMVDHDGW